MNKDAPANITIGEWQQLQSELISLRRAVNFLESEVQHIQGLMQQYSHKPEQDPGGNEQIVRTCLEELKERKLAKIPSSVARLIKQKGLTFEGDYDQLSALVWKVLDDPEAERAYKRIVEWDK